MCVHAHLAAERWQELNGQVKQIINDVGVGQL
jgi:hypothetical protein